MTATICPTCGGLDGAHGLVHVRYGNGAGGNRPCPRGFDLDAIRERAEAATAGPWQTDIRMSYTAVWGGAEESRVNCADASRHPDAEFIAHAREDVPALVAEVERLRKWDDHLERELSEERAASYERDVHAKDVARERDRLAAAAQRVHALHQRRPHQLGDFVAFGQTEFPDVCAHCGGHETWPCRTRRALDGGGDS